MRRASFPIILATMLTLATVIAASASGHHRSQDCRFASLQGSRSMNVHEAHLTVACAVARMPVEGGVAKADCIISHESGFYERAYNPSGASGEMQILAQSTWRSWAQHFASWRHRLHISANVFKGRANILVGIRAAHEWGWGSWTTNGAC